MLSLIILHVASVYVTVWVLQALVFLISITYLSYFTKLKGNSSENIISVEIHLMDSVYTITRCATFLVNKCVHILRKSKLNTSQNLQSAILNQLLPVTGVAM